MKARGLRCEYETMGVRVSTTFEQRVIVRKSVCVCERERKTKTQRSCSECIYGKAEREKESERVRALLRNERERGLMHTLSLSHSRELLLTLFV